MPKFLKFMLNFFAVLTVLFFIVMWFAQGPFLPFSIFFKDIEINWYMWLFLLSIFLLLHRVAITTIDFFLIGPHLHGENLDNKLLKINAHIACSLYFSSIFLTLFFLAFLNRLIGLANSPYIVWVLITLIAGLVGWLEAYIKTDYFIEKHMITNPKKVAWLLSFIIIPMYVLPAIGLILLMRYG